MKKIFFIFIIIGLFFTSCVSSSITTIDFEDYGIFDAPDQIVYKSSADGMIDSTQYAYDYNPYSHTVIETKCGWARLTSKPTIRKECLKKACKFSYENGFDYIVIFIDNEEVYQEFYDIRYTYSILFLPIKKEDVYYYSDFTIYKNTLYYQPK